MSLQIKDAAGTVYNLTSSGDGGSSTQFCVQQGPVIAVVSATFNRPADTTPYTAADLVANSTASGSVTPLSWTAARTTVALGGGTGQVRRARLRKTDVSPTNASFRLHLYGASPTVANGDNAAFSSIQSSYLGSFSLVMSGSLGVVFSNGVEVVAAPDAGSEVNFSLASGQTIYGLLEAKAAYTPASGETFTCELEIHQS